MVNGEIVCISKAFCPHWSIAVRCNPGRIGNSARITACRTLLGRTRNTMNAYLVVDSKLNNPELYEQYKQQARPIAEKFGGEYLSRGGTITLKEKDLWSPTRMVLVRFPSVEKAQAFYDSAEYQQVLKISQQSAERTVFILEGL